jgi:4-hydroxybenzoate polyprenyltransferase
MAVTAVAAPRSAGRAALVALRPRQWTKNLLLFAGLLFAGKIGETSLWLDACVAFVAYCAASSASYLANDVRDAPHDREHPVKRLRPIATGELPTRLAIALAVVLACAAFGLAAYLGPWSIAFMAGFLALQTAYSAGLKHVVLIDVLVIAALFVVRASAGAEAVDVHISPWLLICTGLLALFLALAKRRAELVAASTVIAYSLYTFGARDSKAMMATVPFVVYGVFRYLLLLHRHDLGEEPENVLLTDVPLIVTLVAWAATSAVILGLT